MRQIELDYHRRVRGAVAVSDTSIVDDEAVAHAMFDGILALLTDDAAPDAMDVTERARAIAEAATKRQ